LKDKILQNNIKKNALPNGRAFFMCGKEECFYVA
jgi:hypothetical protein